jgi:phosphatidylserine/phosphatidylglycerophosphate/cardiolipin synthase-like enzyme
MPTLSELREKWFIKPSQGDDPALPPVHRHTGSTVSDYTDENMVTFLQDGKDFMREWHDAVDDLTTKQGGEIFHSGWRFEAVKTLGESVPASDALEMLAAAAAAGVSVYVLLSRHGLGLPSALNRATIWWLQSNAVDHACMDNRFPAGGSNHQKAVVFKHPSGSSAVLGSVDISKTRWDTSAHKPVDSERNSFWGKQTHDTGVKIVGPAVADVERAFRARWNDPSRTFGMEPVLVPQPLIGTPIAAPTSAGPHSVQLLQTYGITEAIFGYSWYATGEFTYWASFLNAIKTATDYLYIEDQYFLAGGTPPFCLGSTPGFARDTEPIYQLGQALLRGVKVVVVTPSNAEDIVHEYIKYQRDLGIEYLYECDAGAGRLALVSLEEQRSPIYVHSKLLVVDDEFALIGSANVGQRSIACDGELSVGVVDANGLFAKQVRTTLWAEHLRLTPSDVEDVDATMDRFHKSQGRIRPYPYATPTAKGKPTQHDRTVRNVVDPYYGPPR